ncbi:MAG: sulfatase, partial [Phycisphaerae bacterium]
MGDLFDTLRKMDLYEQALIVVTSDHGESLGGHNQIGHGGLYLEQLMVPLIVKFPASWKQKPMVVAQPIELLDVMPTILDACGITPPNDLDGQSLLPFMDNTTPSVKYLVAQMTFREGRASISNPAKRAALQPGRWLLIHDARTPSWELFDLTADPLGLVDVANQKPPSVLPLMAALADRDKGVATATFVAPITVEITDELRKQLESLGYVGD